MSIDKDALENACLQLKIDSLDYDEYEFLREYHNIMSLVATAMQTLEANCYTFGIYIPTLLGLNYQLKKMIVHLSSKNYHDYDIDNDGGKFNCLPLVRAIKQGFDQRFGELIDPFSLSGKSIPLFVAMMSNPTFKLNFMCVSTISEQLLSHLKEMLVSAAIIAYNDEYPSETHNNCDDLNSLSSALHPGTYICFT